MRVEVEPDGDRGWSCCLSVVVMSTNATPRSAQRVRSIPDDRNMGHFWAWTCTWSWPAARGTGRRWSARCARPCAAGRLAPAPGCRPPARSPRDLGIARNTVADAYGQLVAEGWLTARAGLGHPGRRPRTPGPPVAARRPRPRPPARPATTCAPGTPTCRAFPRAAWLAAARRALAAAPDRGARLRRPARPPGAARARWPATWPGPAACASTRTASWSAPASPRRWGCSAGAGRRGATPLAVEALRPRRATAARGQRRGLRLRPLPVDGARRRRQRARRRRRRCCSRPAHQFPLGVPLAPAAPHAGRRLGRRAPAGWSSRTTTTASSATTASRSARCRRSPPSTSSTPAPPARASRPALRLGWLVLPGRAWSTRWSRPRRWPTGSSSALDQLTLAELIASGGYDRQVRRMRLAYRRRRDQLVAALRASRARRSGSPASRPACTRCSSCRRARARRRWSPAAAAHGLALDGLAATPPGRARPPGAGRRLRHPARHAFTGAVARLCAVLAARLAARRAAAARARPAFRRPGPHSRGGWMRGQRGGAGASGAGTCARNPVPRWPASATAGRNRDPGSATPASGCPCSRRSGRPRPPRSVPRHRPAGSFTTSLPRTNMAKILFWYRSAERPNPPPPRGGVTPSAPISSSTRSW